MQPGGRIGRFLIEAQRANRGSAAVYEIRDGQHQYVLELLDTHNEQVLRRLMREDQSLARLRHENVVGVIEVLDIDGRPGIVMEPERGQTLTELLTARRASGRRLLEEEVDAIGRGMLLGLAEAHRLNFVHGGLGPDSVLLKDGSPKLVAMIRGFGIAKAMSADPTHAARSMIASGQPCYLSPEQILDPRRADERSDLFSLAALLYELLTGTVPVARETPLQHAPALDLPSLRMFTGGHVPERMLQAIEAALVSDPAHRIGTCEGLHALWRGVSGPTLSPIAASSWMSHVPVLTQTPLPSTVATLHIDRDETPEIPPVSTELPRPVAPPSPPAKIPVLAIVVGGLFFGGLLFFMAGLLTALWVLP